LRCSRATSANKAAISERIDMATPGEVIWVICAPARVKEPPTYAVSPLIEWQSVAL
jgi:hypothetical protein